LVLTFKAKPYFIDLFQMSFKKILLMHLFIYFTNLKGWQKYGKKKLVATHLQLLQDRLVNKHLNFKKISNPNTLSFCFSNVKGFKNFDLVHPQPFRLSKNDTKWKRYDCQK
jgi:hypothetical protein